MNNLLSESAEECRPRTGSRGVVIREVENAPGKKSDHKRQVHRKGEFLAEFNFTRR